jgi:hypothetical protein
MKRITNQLCEKGEETVKGKSALMMLAALLCATVCATWVWAGEPQAGKTYNKDNIAEIKEFVPTSIQTLLTTTDWYGDDLVLTVQETHNYIKEGLNPFWYEATEANKGKASISPEGVLTNWVGGLPFGLEPKNGLELSKNIDLHYRGDDAWSDWEVPNVLKGRVERTTLAICKMLYMESEWGPGRRFFCEKLPNPEKIQEYYFVGIYGPEEVASLQTMEVRYYDPKKPDDMWAYVPSMRRIRRMSTAQRMDSWAGSDSTYDDFDGWHGKSGDWNFNLRGKKKMLVPRNVPESAKYTKNLSMFSPMAMQVTDCFQVEFIPKDPNHIYSKSILLIDPETFEVSWRENYDRKGNLWKAHFGPVEFRKMNYPCAGKDILAALLTGGAHMDLQRGHYSWGHATDNKKTYGMKRQEMTVEAMRTFGR